MMIVRVVTKLETSLIDDARVVIYHHHMFIGQATIFRPRSDDNKLYFE
jgi:hypothetical protein